MPKTDKDTQAADKDAKPKADHPETPKAADARDRADARAQARQTTAAEPKENPENPSRPQDPAPDDMQTPKNFTASGDAVPMDPMLDPSAQQPFESYEDWQRRTGHPRPTPGVFDATVRRGRDPQ